MAKVNFELVKASITDENFGGCHKRNWARCDLALPAAEMRAIAGVLDALPWIEQAAEMDGALYIRPQYKIPWLVQERAFHQALAIVRRRVTEMLHHLRTDTPAVTPEPEMVRRYVLNHRGSYANVAPSGEGSRVIYSDDRDTGDVAYIMPEGHYGTGFVVHHDENGRPRGYFLVSDRYDDKKKPLATALLATLFPALGIDTWHRLKGYGEVEMQTGVEGLRDIGAACYNAAVTLIERCRKEIAALQWNGQPSVFTDEDDAARDWLLDEMRAGATIERVHREGADYNDVDGVCEFTLSDGTPLVHYIVTRLQNAQAVLPVGYPFEHSTKPDEPLVPLIYNPKLDKELVAPRSRCMPFQAFQSYCAHRRHDGDRECAHPTGGGDYCGAGYCPITQQVYAEDVGRYGMDYNDDPAFDDTNWERDTMVRALHRNTERSYAWRAAGEDAVMAIVNRVIHARYAMGIECHLYGSENMRAVREAISSGWLVVEQEMPDFGVVVKLSETTIAKVEEQRAAHAAHLAEAGKATVDAG